MTAHQATNRARSRYRQNAGGSYQGYAHAEAWRTDNHGRLATRNLAGETIVKPFAGMEHTIPRVEGGRPLPSELRGAIVAIGNFDGFHIGHQAVVARAVKMARERGVAAIAATFDPHPIRHFVPGAVPFDLTTLDQRQLLFARAGADAMMVFHFDGDLAAVTPEDFVRHWLAGAGGVVTGDGFSFGRGRNGTVQVLAELADLQGLAYEAVKAVSLGDECVSSTRIRNALKQGDCETARMLLSRPFAVCGRLQLRNRSRSRYGLSLGSVDMVGYLRPRCGTYEAVARLADGHSFRCTVHVEPSAAAETEQDWLWLVAQDLQDDMQGCFTEIEFMGCLSDARGGP